MKIAFFDTHQFEKDAFLKENKNYNFAVNFLDTNLTVESAQLAKGSQVICSFVNDKIDDKCIQSLKEIGVKLIALRSAGFNHVDLVSARKNGITVVRVPSYSPHSIAEFAVSLLLTLNRKTHRAYNRVRELNFSLDGLIGFDVYGKTIGVIGAGKIGRIFAQIMAAFGCKVLIHDIQKEAELENNPSISYTDCITLCKLSDVISLHIPLTPQTHHLINSEKFAVMKNNALLINTGRGALIDTKALINALKTKKIGGAALDVYEEEENIFFHDLSNQILQDDLLARLLTFPNVLITSHQAFLTNEALTCIAATTLKSIDEFKKTNSVSRAVECIKLD